MELKSEPQSFQRKRGRPACKNRAPLSQEERRARNAQYEKQRRDEHAQAAAMLAEAAGCEPNLPLILLLDRVTTFLSTEAQRDPSDDVVALRNLNEKLMHQIITLEERLQCEDNSKLSAYDHKEVPIRTHSNQVLTKRVKLDLPFPAFSSESRPEETATSNTSLTHASVLNEVISLEEEKVTQLQVPEQSQWSMSSVLDDFISLEEERKVLDDDYQWSATDFSLELL